jgi:heme oxygenase
MAHLSQQLRNGTQQAHTLSENTAYMKCFIKGIVEEKPFRQLLANLYFVYSALEQAFERNQHHPILGKIYFPLLNRHEQLAQDLAFYYGDNWQQEIQPTPSGKVYVDRINDLINNNPALLVAHSYTRYMGDLSGGQALKRIVRSALTLPENQGTAMYEFPGLETPEERRQFKEIYRHALDALELDQGIKDEIVAEANYAFALNRDVMHDLEGAVKEAIGEHTFDLLTRQDRPGSTESHTHGHGNVAIATAQ